MSERFENVTVNLADNVAVSNYIKGIKDCVSALLAELKVEKEGSDDSLQR